MAETAETKAAVKENLISRTLLSLQYRSFRFLWLGSVTEHSGEFMENLAVSWLIWERTQSSLSVGLMLAIRAFPLFIFPFLGGLAADRLNRRHLLRLTLLALSAGSLALLVITKAGVLEVWHLYLYSVYGGIVISFNHPARQTLVPNLVKREHLMNAISLDTWSVSASRVLIMPLAGYIMSYLGTEAGAMALFGVRAAFCLLAVLWLQRVVAPPTQPRPRQNPWREMGDGVRYSVQHKTILSLQLLFIVPLILLVPISFVLLPAFADDVLGMGVGGLGLLQAISGAGSMVGILSIAYLGDYQGKGRLFFILAVGSALSFFFLSLSPWVALVFPALFLAVATQAGKDAVWNTTMQSSIPDEVRGRVMSLRETMRGFTPLGSLMVGVLADAMGVQKAIGILAIIGGLLMLGAALLLPKVRRLQ